MAACCIEKASREDILSRMKSLGIEKEFYRLSTSGGISLKKLVRHIGKEYAAVSHGTGEEPLNFLTDAFATAFIAGYEVGYWPVIKEEEYYEKANIDHSSLKETKEIELYRDEKYMGNLKYASTFPAYLFLRTVFSNDIFDGGKKLSLQAIRTLNRVILVDGGTGPEPDDWHDMFEQDIEAAKLAVTRIAARKAMLENSEGAFLESATYTPEGVAYIKFMKSIENYQDICSITRGIYLLYLMNDRIIKSTAYQELVMFIIREFPRIIGGNDKIGMFDDLRKSTVVYDPMMVIDNGRGVDYLSNIIGEYIGSGIFERILINSKLVKAIMEQTGLEKKQAKDLAIVAATVNAVMIPPSLVYLDASAGSEENTYLRKEIEDCHKRIENFVNAIDKEKRSHAQEKKQLSEKTRDAERRASMLEKKLAELEDAHEREKKALQDKLAEMEETITDIADNSDSEDTAADDIPFPYRTEKKVVIVGGFDVFHGELQKLLPDIQIVQATRRNADLTPIIRADLVCFQVNYCGHPQYYAAVKVVRNGNTPHLHLRNANAAICARQIVAMLEKQE